MFSLAITGLALSSIYANIAELRTNARALSLAIAGLQTNYGRRRSFGSIEVEELLSEGTLINLSFSRMNEGKIEDIFLHVGADLILDYAPMLRPFVHRNFPSLGIAAESSSSMYQLVPDVSKERNDDVDAVLTTYYKKMPSPCLLSKRTGDIDRQAVVSPGGLFAFTNVLATGVGGVATTSTLDSVAVVLGNAGSDLKGAEAAVASFISAASAAAAAAAAAAATVSFLD